MNSSWQGLLDSLTEQVDAALPLLGRASEQKPAVPPSTGNAEPVGRPLNAQVLGSTAIQQEGN
jgi:hypothetical protein